MDLYHLRTIKTKGGGIHMRHFRSILPIAVLAMMLLAVAPASAEVVWDHTLTDDPDDVESVLEPNNPLSDKGQVDILSASVTGQGDDVNVTLSLSGARDAEGDYLVHLKADDDDAKKYEFTFSFGIAQINGPGLVEDTPSFFISADGTKLSWEIEKSKIDATGKVEVTYARAFVIEGFTQYVDTAPDEGNGGNGGGNGGGPSDPVTLQVSIEFLKLERVRYTIEVVQEGDDAKDVRGEFDTDVDGTVTKAEYDQHIEFYQLLHSSWNSTDIKLNGKKPQSRVMTFGFEGVIGSATSTSPVTQVVVLDVHFAEPVAASTHTYADFLSSSESAGDMWDVTTDSLFHMSAPDGWKFKNNDWPDDLKTYANNKGTSVTMSGFQMRTDWNTTMGVMTSLVVTERTDEPIEEETPGFAVIPMVAVLAVVAAVLVSRRR
jgi:hypothetical protein